ncbi:MAG: DUF4430 domain-containing protein [Candidatus Shapirobacteria bacterium]|jgi:hypothetical protein
MKKRNGITIVLVVLFLVLVFGFQKTKFNFFKENKPEIIPQETNLVLIDIFSYSGEKGIDALTLLKNKAKVEENKAGLVISINERKAESEKHEYWAFYINDKMSNIGPADYKTTDSDIITWKIEKY